MWLSSFSPQAQSRTVCRLKARPISWWTLSRSEIGHSSEFAAKIDMIVLRDAAKKPRDRGFGKIAKIVEIERVR